MALRFHWIPILSSTFIRDKHPQALTLQHKPSSQKPISVSSSSSQIPTFQAIASVQVENVENNLILQPPLKNHLILLLSSEENEPKTTVLAHNVPWTYTVKDIRNLFQKCGTVKDIDLPYNLIRNRGLAFVTMGSAEEAAAAMTNLQSYVLMGRRIRVAFLKKKRKIKEEVKNEITEPTELEASTEVDDGGLSKNVV